MTFWGACVTSNEPYNLELDGKRLRIKQATLEPWNDGLLTNATSILQCTVGSKPPISICSLSKDFAFTQLDLELEESEQVIFTVKGSQIIHLSGYYVPPCSVPKREAITSRDDLKIDCSSEADTIMAKNLENRKLATEDRDIFKTDRFDDGGQNSNSNHDCHIGDALINDKVLLSNAKMHKDGLCPDRDFLINDIRDALINDSVLVANSDMHKDADEQTVYEQLEFLYAPDSMPDTEDVDHFPFSRTAETTERQILRGKHADRVIVHALPANNALKAINNISEETDNGASRQSQKERKHNSYADLVEDGHRSDKEIRKKKKRKIKSKQNGNCSSATSSKARDPSNGLIIEELARGGSGGEVAAPGRMVEIFYTARLRETESLLESNFGEEKPFKFCLGDKKIIKGWNLGIDGMHIGDKRRLIIPPWMGYGKAALDVIPPDSWLMYDVELVSVH